MSDQVIIFDTTLRDGEQCPGASMNLREKMEVARQLARLNVDVIEAGFPVISKGDFEAVQQIATEIKGPIITGLARCVPGDIDAAGAAVAPAGARGRIHVFVSSSAIHLEHQMRKQREQVLPLVTSSVQRARGFVRDVEFSPMDATRTDPEFLALMVQTAIEAGATTVNIPDTVGIAMPDQFAELIGYLRAHVRNIDDAVISVHCHNDLGLAVANSLAAVRAGARQVEGTINGIGERAGNAALEEVVMALRTRPDVFAGVTTQVNTREIVKSSRLISRMSGLLVPRSKAIVGENAFAHSSGIHQDGMIKNRSTYEIMDPHEVGWGDTELPLTKHSGRAAMVQRLVHLGHDRLGAGEVDSIFRRFKEVGDRKKFVYDDDLAALVEDSASGESWAETYELEYIHVTSGTTTVPTATVRVRKGAPSANGAENGGGESWQDSAPGNGAVDAAMKAIDRVLGRQGNLVEYHVQGVTSGQDALGEVTLKVDFGDGKLITGKGASTDVIEASARAYLHAVGRVLAAAGTKAPSELAAASTP
jgi:2-isopropylmalate synthase